MVDDRQCIVSCSSCAKKHAIQIVQMIFFQYEIVWIIEKSHNRRFQFLLLQSHLTLVDPERLEHLRSLFIKLREADLKLKEVKCNFLKKHIQYLGHIVSGKGITPLPEKLESIQKILPPKTPKEVKQFLIL